jgi:osmotically-inducible protein OsmY
MKRISPHALLVAALAGLFALASPVQAQEPDPAPAHEAFGVTHTQSRLDLDDEPGYHTTPAAHGQKSKSQEETATTEPTTFALEQGVSYRDIDRTVLINREIRAARLPARNVEVGTLHGRVTLRGWVPTENAREKIGQIAVASSRLELVDNQLVVGARPANARTGQR